MTIKLCPAQYCRTPVVHPMVQSSKVLSTECSQILGSSHSLYHVLRIQRFLK